MPTTPPPQRRLLGNLTWSREGRTQVTTNSDTKVDGRETQLRHSNFAFDYSTTIAFNSLGVPNFVSD